MKRQSLMVLLIMVTVPALAGFREMPEYRSVLDAHYIEAGGTGLVEVAFRDAVILFERVNLLDDVQAAYAQRLGEGEKPEFVIAQESTNRWSYVNKSGHESVIQELHRAIQTNGNNAAVVYYTEGERFFGKFRAIIEVLVQPAGEGDASRYEVAVYAYPVNSFSRFFARHLGVVDRFFRDKTREITQLAVTICRDLMDAPDQHASR
jgi:hypothetical protein